jgi:Mrp family chromosome partitioning ATPase
MTRIFDALRKARTLSGPPAAPTPGTSFSPAAVLSPPSFAGPVALVPPAEAAAPRPALPPPVLVALPSFPPLGDDVVREMSTLRVHLESALTERTPRKVMLVSAQGGDGTTTVAAQLAATLARDGSLRVLLVDAHARRPILSERNGSGSPQRKLFAKRNPASVPDPAISERLRLLPLPEEFRGPGGVSLTGMRQLIEAAEPGFDWVIIDGPPVLESPDAAGLANAADGVVMVVQAGRTKRPVLTRSVELLRKGGARVLGTVLNRRRLEIPGFIYRRI